MNTPTPPLSKSIPSIWKNQVAHVALLAVLLLLTWMAWEHIGRPVPVLFWTVIAVPILHQIYVWFTWRTELQHAAVSNKIGFRPYLFLFFVLLIGRVLVFIPLAWVDMGSLAFPMLPRILLTSLFAGLGIYTMYSVKTYFGFLRAAGADHFDPSYRDLPLVKQGAFRWTGNAMYVLGFLLFWAIAIGFASEAGMVAAAFSHVYIWVHYYVTERPDMIYLYSESDE